MMKKAISLFLAVSVLCIATSAMAAPTTNSLGGNVRNGASSLPTAPSNMPCFRNGDTISFTVSAVTSGKELTLISYKNGTTPSSSTVNYINQYTLATTSQDISYTIPSTAESGTYIIKINDEEGTAATFYYKVGNIEVGLIHSRNESTNNGTYTTGQGSPYMIKYIESSKNGHAGTWSVAFLGKVTVQGTATTLSELGAVPGFTVKKNSSASTYKTSKFDGTNGNPTVSELYDTKKQVNGNWSFVYALTIYNISSESNANAMVATATLD